MRARASTRRAHIGIPVGLTAFAILLVGVVLATPSAADPRLEEAKEETKQRQDALDTLLGRIDELEASIDEHEGELDALEETRIQHADAAEESISRVAEQLRASYMHGSSDPFLHLLVAEDATAAAEQSRLLSMVGAQHQGNAEEASAARRRIGATAERVQELLTMLDEDRADLEDAKDEAATLLAAAEDEEEEVREVIRQEEEEERRRREAEERRAAMAQRVSRSSASDGGGSGQSAASDGPSGSIACPVAQPRSFTDTYGAPRSGGRGHMGTDILAPMGTHIYAYEAGTISRMQNNRLGGITLYLQGESGTTYYYAHLSGYVDGLSTGQQVSAGEHIAFNGDTGNARGVPHLHIEVMPGGGGNVNPYPHMREACG